MKDSYSEKQAEEILRRAAQADSRDVSREQLLSTAAELGISAARLREAEVSYLAEEKAKKEFSRKAIAARRDFTLHLVIYAIVIGGLAMIDLFENGQIDFVYFPMIAWGIGLAIHAYSAFFVLPHTPEPDPQPNLLTDQDQLFRLVSREQPVDEAVSSSS